VSFYVGAPGTSGHSLFVLVRFSDHRGFGFFLVFLIIILVVVIVTIRRRLVIQWSKPPFL
jgi:hypothetical protein